jgi:hypothetical protein
MKQDAKTMIGGDAWCEQATLQAAFALENGSPRQALEIAKNVLARKDLMMSGVYPALTALCAGLEQLAGKPGAARELLDNLRWSTVTSGSEKKLVQSAEVAGAVQIPRNIAVPSPVVYWYCWNAAAACAGRRRWQMAARWCDLARESGKGRVTQAQKRLLAALRLWCTDRRKQNVAMRNTGANSESTKKRLGGNRAPVPAVGPGL